MQGLSLAMISLSLLLALQHLPSRNGEKTYLLKMVCGCLCGEVIKNGHTRSPLSLTVWNADVNVQLHVILRVFILGTLQQQQNTDIAVPVLISNKMIYIYIYIYIERERERERDPIDSHNNSTCIDQQQKDEGEMYKLLYIYSMDSHNKSTCIDQQQNGDGEMYNMYPIGSHSNSTCIDQQQNGEGEV